MLFLSSNFNGEIIINTRAHFYMNDFFELFCIENDFVEIHFFLQATRVRPQPSKLLIFSRFSGLKVAQ